MLQLQNLPVRLPGAISNPETFDFPLRYRQVPGAWSENIVGEDMAVLDAYIDEARRLEAEGARAITTNCGFTARFQREVAAAVSIPVGLSSLLLVPLMAHLAPPGRKLGVVTYDSTQLTEHHFNGAGWSAADLPVEVVGIEGSESWAEMAKPEPALTVPMLERDVVAAVRGLLAREPTVSALVLECSAFPIVAAAVRRETGLPTTDFSTLARILAGAVMPRADLVAAARARRPIADADAPLGLLRLGHSQIEEPGAIAVPGSYAYPMRMRPVPGAWAHNVTKGDRSVVPAYIQTARDLAADGCAALITTCGFTAGFQAELAAAVPVPFLTSSMLLVPLVKNMLPRDGKIALLTYDRACLTEALCNAAGFSLEDGLVVAAGVDGTESWHQLRAEHPALSAEALGRDVGAALDGLRAAHPDVRAIVLECAVFPIVADGLRAKTGLPVFDFLTLADVAMEAAPRFAAAARVAAE